MKRIWHISDTHTWHERLCVPENIDIVIHSGDATNPRDTLLNTKEMESFIDWYSMLPITNKIYVAGNHDLSIERKKVTGGDFSSKGIIYLENASTTVEGLKIFGSPITPSFGTGWAFNKDRAKLDVVWRIIPDDTDIIVTHGPPKGILDLSINKQDDLEHCGDACLKRRVFNIRPILHCYGHIHNYEDCLNSGYTKLADMDTIFSNGAVVTDRKFDYGPTSNGNIFELDV